MPQHSQQKQLLRRCIKGRYWYRTTYTPIPIFKRMNAFELQMAESGKREVDIGRDRVEPDDETVYFVGHLVGGGRFETNHEAFKVSGDDLHSIRMRQVNTDGLDMPVTGRRHLMPADRGKRY